MQTGASLCTLQHGGGACAGVTYNVALFPIDTVKSAMQTEAELRGPRGPGEARATFAGTAREMWRKGGVRGLYAGCGITVARAVPSSALIFLIYDGLSQRFASGGRWSGGRA